MDKTRCNKSANDNAVGSSHDARSFGKRCQQREERVDNTPSVVGQELHNNLRRCGKQYQQREKRVDNAHSMVERELQKFSISPINPTLNIMAECVGKFTNLSTHKDVDISDFKWRCLYEPSVKESGISLDLNHGFETFQHDYNYDGKIDPILRYLIKMNVKGSTLRNAVHKCDFVTNRGSLTDIGAYLYMHRRREPFEIVCCSFQGIIFMCKRICDGDRLAQKNVSLAEKRDIYYGHKFEQYLTTRSADVCPDTDEPVSTLTPQYGVFKSIIDLPDGHTLSFFVNAEMDGIGGDGKFVELKTQVRRPPKHPWHQTEDEPNWRYKSRSKWWLQSYLIGVEQFYVGMKSADGIVRSVKQINTGDIEKTPKEWSPSVCLNTLVEFLDGVRRKLAEKPERTLLKATFRRFSQGFEMSWVGEEECCEYEFLLPEFVKHFTLN